LSRRDVVARLPVILEGNCVEVFGEDLLTARESVAAKHDCPRPAMIFSHSWEYFSFGYDDTASSEIFPSVESEN
jgi:hypothetical protein